MYKILSTATVISNTTATALTQGSIGGSQLVYICMANASGTTCYLTVAAGTAVSPFNLPTAETWMFGPVEGKHIAEHGLYNAVGAKNISVTFVAGTPVLGSVPAGNSKAPAAKEIAPIALTWSKLA